MSRSARLFGLVTVSFLAMNAARAQTAAQPGDAAEKTAPSAVDANATPLDEITVTSTKTENSAVDTLGGASVVSRGEIEAIQPDRVSDMLRQVPGVTTQENHNDPAQSINIRGLQDFGRVNVLVDGARQDFQTSGHGANGVFYLDPELISGIDITRGPVSTIYGSGAIGGVASFRTLGIDDILKPDEQAGAVQKIGGGTNGYGIVNSSAVGVRLPNNAANVFGQFVYRQNYTYKDGLGFLVPDTGSDLVAGNFKLEARPADGHVITATALKQNFDFANQGTSNEGPRFRDHVTSDTYTLGYRLTPPGQPLFDLSLKAYYTQTQQNETFLQDTSDGTYSALGARPGSQSNFHIQTYGFDAFNTSRFETGPFSHALTYGGDAVWDTVHTFDNAGGYGSALTPTGHRELNGAFVQDEVRLGSWLRAVGAVRYDRYDLEGGAYTSSGDRVSPRFTLGIFPFKALGFGLLDGIEFYGTYAEGYRAPSITETLINGQHPFPAFSILPNPGLKPEVARNVEGGVNIKYNDIFTVGDTFRAKVTGYRNDVENYIDLAAVGTPFLVPFIPGLPVSACGTQPFLCFPIQSFQYLNDAKAQLSGEEVEGAYDWGDGFVSVAQSHVMGTNKVTGDTLLTIPPDKVSGTLGLRFLDRRLTVGGRLTFNSSRLDVPSDATILGTKAYTVTDLFASYDYNEWVRGDLTLSNVFDRRYKKYLDLDESPGFQARGSLTVKFVTR